MDIVEMCDEIESERLSARWLGLLALSGQLDLFQPLLSLRMNCGPISRNLKWFQSPALGLELREEQVVFLGLFSAFLAVKSWCSAQGFLHDCGHVDFVFGFTFASGCGIQMSTNGKYSMPTSMTPR
eukprot:TRINITY_DN4411_c0_g2_i2.p1 TRINITY_DN4411_c0_g2~~TRINITY_DN4411_c0_g2_i2.p1  ORF type:complete len:126 (+),score=19.47 TRINITY_DN4411_c0_g2_i2:63-440(+)